MARKLTSLKPRLGLLSPRVSGIPRIQQERERNQRRAEANAWRSWYSTERWRELRLRILKRDRYTCQRTGVLLTGKHPAPDSPVVDHIKPHRGDPELFWDESNLQAVSKRYHDSIKQAIERADQVAAIHPKWLKPAIIPVTVICGPPASGKTTYANIHAGPRDTIIDLDAIASEISGEPMHGWDRGRWLNAALFRRNDMLGDLSRPSPYHAAWFIVSEPKARHRQWWQDTLKPVDIVVLETPEARCIANAQADPERDQKATADAIVKWWFEYDMRDGDTVIR
jgi:hypothetical protein